MQPGNRTLPPSSNIHDGMHPVPVPPGALPSNATRRTCAQQPGLAAVVLPSLYPIASSSSPRRRQRAKSGPMQPTISSDGGQKSGVIAKPEIAWGYMAPRHGQLPAGAVSIDDPDGRPSSHGLRGNHPYSAPLSTSSSSTANHHPKPSHMATNSRVGAPPPPPVASASSSSTAAHSGGVGASACMGAGGAADANVSGCVGVGGCGAPLPLSLLSGAQLCVSAFRGGGAPVGTGACGSGFTGGHVLHGACGGGAVHYVSSASGAAGTTVGALMQSGVTSGTEADRTTAGVRTASDVAAPCLSSPVVRSPRMVATAPEDEATAPLELPSAQVTVAADYSAPAAAPSSSSGAPSSSSGAPSSARPTARPTMARGAAKAAAPSAAPPKPTGGAGALLLAPVGRHSKEGGPKEGGKLSDRSERTDRLRQGLAAAAARESSARDGGEKARGERSRLAAPGAKGGAFRAAVESARSQGKPREGQLVINLKDSKNAASIVREVAASMGWRESHGGREDDCQANVFWYDSLHTCLGHMTCPPHQSSLGATWQVREGDLRGGGQAPQRAPACQHDPRHA